MLPTNIATMQALNQRYQQLRQMLLQQAQQAMQQPAQKKPSIADTAANIGETVLGEKAGTSALGSGAAAAANAGATYGPLTAEGQMLADLGFGQNAAVAGGDLLANTGLAGIGEATGTGAFGSVAIPAAAALAYGNNLWEGGVKDIVKGKGTSSDYANLVMDINPMTAWINPLTRVFGGKSVGKMLFGGPTVGQIQEGRADKLKKQGVAGFADYWDQAKAGAEEARKSGFQDKSAYAAGLAPDFVGVDSASGRWVNNKFAKSRNEKDLQAEDIWGGTGLFETFGNDWLGKFNEQQRRDISNELLKNNLVKEQKAGIYVTDQDKARALAEQYLSGGQPSPTPGTTRPAANTTPNWLTGKVLQSGVGYAPAPSLGASNLKTPQSAILMKGWDPKSSPTARADYNSLSSADKENLWKQHRTAMGATW